jgi:hypothetical protein
MSISRPLYLYEAAWLAQMREDTFYRHCRLGKVRGAYQSGRAWLIDGPAFSRSLRGAASQLAGLLGADEIEIDRLGSRSMTPLPLTVYRWMRVTSPQSNSCPQGDAETCTPESDTRAHLRTASEHSRGQ